MKSTLEKYHLYFFILLFFSIGIQGIAPALPNIVLGISSGLFLVNIGLSSDYKNIILKNRVFWLSNIIILYLILKFTLNGSILEEFPTILRYMIPFLILIQGIVLNSKKNILIFHVFMFGVAITLCGSIFNLIEYYIENEDLSLNTGHYIDNLIMGGRVYFGYAAATSCIISLYLLPGAKKKVKIIYILNFAILYLFLLVISARLVILVLTFTILLYFIINFKIKYTLLGILGLISVVLTMFLINPNLGDRFLYKDKQKTMLKDFKQWEPRYVIWQCNYDLLFDSENSALFGFRNANEVKNKLVNCYPTKIENNDDKVKYFLREKFNSHNQYFDFIFYGGIILLILFFAFFSIMLIYNPINQFRFYLLFGLLSMLMVENLYHRQFGLYIMGVIYTIFIYFNKRKVL